MKPPVYRQAAIDGVFPPYWCSICSCFVNDRTKHTSFHTALNRLLGLVWDNDAGEETPGG